MKKVTVDGENRDEGTMLLRRSKVEVTFNDENLQIFGENNEIKILHNTCNFHVYGDHNTLLIRANDSNLHVYGDFLSVLVENNNCNLHIYGDHNNVSVERGRAVVYGHYGSLTLHPHAEVEVHGGHKSINRL